MIVDANVLLYASDSSSAFHGRAHAWLAAALAGEQRIGLPWVTTVAFLRISTHPRVFRRPFSPVQAWARIAALLDADVTWIPEPSERHASVLGRLLTAGHLTGSLVPDAHLAALAIEHGVAVVSADSDFARFPDVHWVNPLAG